MPLQQTSGAASYDAFGGGAPVAAKYIEDFFQTWLRTGTGSSTTVTTGLNASINKSLVWTKSRSAATNHKLTDTARGVTKALSSNTTGAEVTDSQGLTAFSSTGYTIGTNTDYNNSGATYVDWQWVATPKFFDVVTYTGTGSTQTIAHNLGSVPGCIIVKATNDTRSWAVYHRSLGATKYIYLNSTGIGGTTNGFWDDTEPTSTAFTVRNDGDVNGPGTTYVAYLFAHNAGGFGLTGTDNVISCGSFTADGSGNASVTLGYEPQFWLYKPVGTGGWTIYDTMRGWSQTSIFNLNPNTSGAEGGGSVTAFYPTATGFDCVGGNLNPSASYIYIAIRRGPMKPPTTGTSVFSPQTANYSPNQVVTTGFPVDMLMMALRAGGFGTLVYDRLRGLASTNTSPVNPQLLTQSTAAETSGDFVNTANNTGYQISPGFTGSPSVNWNFRRAPGFFDEVCYTGNDVLRTITHNLGVAPEMMIIKNRDSALEWAVYHAGIGNTKYLFLNSTAAEVTASSYWNNTSPTASVFTVNTSNKVNSAPSPYVAYLFASCPGVSKVFSYTGNGSSQTINCGFTGGARFVMIKRTDSTGDWYVWDTARGIVANNDPHLSLNSTAAEVTTNDTIDTDSTGFVVNQVAATNVNVSSATYIGLAIA